MMNDYFDIPWSDIDKEYIFVVKRTCHDVSVDNSVQFYCSECECTVDIPLL